MAVKNTTQVLIDGKIITLSGYESPEYLQKVASYMNQKIGELSQLQGYSRLSVDTKHTLLSLNVADDYFKAREQAEMLEEDMEAKDAESYGLRSELAETKVRLESVTGELEQAQRELQETLERLKNQQTEHAEALEQLRSEKDEELKQLRDEKDAELEQFRGEKDGELKQLRDEKDEELEQLRKEKEALEKQLAEANEELEELLK